MFVEVNITSFQSHQKILMIVSNVYRSGSIRDGDILDRFEKRSWWVELVDEEVGFIFHNESHMVVSNGTLLHDMSRRNCDFLVLFKHSCPWVPFQHRNILVFFDGQEPLSIGSKLATVAFSTDTCWINVIFVILAAIEAVEYDLCLITPDSHDTVVNCGSDKPHRRSASVQHLLQ